MTGILNDFYIDDGYIVKRQKNRKGEVSDKIICNRVEVVKKLFYPETKQTKVVIEISSMNGSNSMEFSCDVFTEQGVNVLLNYGLRFIKSDIPDLINYLIESERKAPLEYRYTSTGWHDTNNGIGFMLDKLYIDGEVQNDSRYAGDLKLEQKGKLKDWISVVKEEVIGKVPLEFVLLLGFSAPLLALLNDSNYDLGSVVFNLANFSSKGKTTAVMLATSVFSNPVSNKGTLVTYNATDNALMNILAKSDGLTIGIDEIGISKHNSKNFSSLLYAICSGSSKLRLNGDSSMKPSQTYSCFVISTAEYDIIDDDTIDGIKARVFEITDELTTSAENSDNIKSVIKNNYGTAGRKFIKSFTEYDMESVMQEYENAKKQLINRVEKFGNIGKRMVSKLAVITLTCKLFNQAFENLLYIDEDEIEEYAASLIRKSDNCYSSEERLMNLIKSQFIENAYSIDTGNIANLDEQKFAIVKKRGCFEIYVEANKFKSLMAENNINNYKRILRQLRSKGVLLSESDRFVSDVKISKALNLCVKCYRFRIDG